MQDNLTKRVFIIRHGQTMMNKSFSMQGRSDEPLNDEGIKQAEETAAWFKEQGITFDRVYTSPLTRAVQTAEIIAGSSVEIIRDQRLVEMEYGPYEGCDLRNPPPELLEFFSDFANKPAPEGMEQLDSVVARLGDFIEEIKSSPEDMNVLVSTHAIAMKGALEYLTDGPKDTYWAQHIGNCAVYETQLIDGAFTVPEERKNI